MFTRLITLQGGLNSYINVKINKTVYALADKP